MAGKTSKAAADQTATDVAPLPAANREELSLADLARGILARELRPRVGEVRRLAQFVSDAEDKRARKKAKEPGGKKKRKLAKIPGQKGKK